MTISIGAVVVTPVWLSLYLECVWTDGSAGVYYECVSMHNSAGGVYHECVSMHSSAGGVYYDKYWAANCLAADLYDVYVSVLRILVL